MLPQPLAPTALIKACKVFFFRGGGEGGSDNGKGMTEQRLRKGKQRKNEIEREYRARI